MFLRLITIFAFCTFTVHAKFAIINISDIEERSIVAKDLKTKLIKATTEIEKEITDTRAEIEKEAGALQKRSSTISPEAVEKQRAELQKKFLAKENDIQAKDQKLQEQRMKALEEINQQVKEISETIAKKENFDAVFANTLVIYYSKDSDITEGVIKELDKKIKKSCFTDCK